MHRRRPRRPRPRDRAPALAPSSYALPVSSVPTVVVEPLGSDIVAIAQCIVLDADAFPYASATFGLRSASARAWIARSEPGSRVVGFLAARVDGRRLSVHGLAVDREARRRGIARSLLREAIAYARDLGLWAVILHVSLANRAAIALYSAEGFSVRRRLRDFYPPAAFDGETDAYEMVVDPRTPT